MSYGGNADASGIQVTFLDQTGAKSVKAVIAFSVPVSRILPNIITKMSLPSTSPDGQPMSYSLDHKEGGRRLIESMTLVEAGVQNGDHLIVYPEVVAGRAEASRADSRLDSARWTPAVARRPSSQGIAARCPPTNRPGSAGSGPTSPRSRSSRRRARSSRFRVDRQAAPAIHRRRSRAQSLARDRGKVGRPRSPRGRDQARRLLPPDHARDPLADADLPPEHLRDRHGLPRGLRDALGPQPGPRRALRHALGHGPVPELRHPQPLQPRGRPVGREPDDLPVPDGPSPAPRRPSRPRPGRVAEVPKAPAAESTKKFPAMGESICILDMEIDLSRASTPSPPRPEPVGRGRLPRLSTPSRGRPRTWRRWTRPS